MEEGGLEALSFFVGGGAGATRLELPGSSLPEPTAVLISSLAVSSGGGVTVLVESRGAGGAPLLLIIRSSLFDIKLIIKQYPALIRYLLRLSPSQIKTIDPARPLPTLTLIRLPEMKEIERTAPNAV